LVQHHHHLEGDFGVSGWSFFLPTGPEDPLLPGPPEGPRIPAPPLGPLGPGRPRSPGLPDNRSTNTSASNGDLNAVGTFSKSMRPRRCGVEPAGTGNRSSPSRPAFPSFPLSPCGPETQRRNLSESQPNGLNQPGTVNKALSKQIMFTVSEGRMLGKKIQI